MMLQKKPFALYFLVFQCLFVPAAFAECEGSELCQKALNVLAMEWRDMHASSNRGNCWTQYMGTWGDPFIQKHQANAAESEEIDKHKNKFKELQKKFPHNNEKNTKADSNDGHKLLMAYADYLDDYADNAKKVITASVVNENGASGEAESMGFGSSWTKTRAGNCGEISATLYKYIYNKYKDLEIAQVRVPGGDHQFVMVKNDCGIYIVDGWTDEGQAVGPLRQQGNRLVDQDGNIPDGYDIDLQVTTTSTNAAGKPSFFQSTGGTEPLI